MASARDDLIRPIGGDLLAFAQCCALDASVFPHTSLPSDATDAVFVARARADGPVVGFAATRTMGPFLEVNGLAVDSAHRGQGFGEALLSRVEIEALEQDRRAVRLHVAVDNKHAINLYTREGFRVVRRARSYYRNGDAFEMRKQVTR